MKNKKKPKSIFFRRILKTNRQKLMSEMKQSNLNYDCIETAKNLMFVEWLKILVEGFRLSYEELTFMITEHFVKKIQKYVICVLYLSIHF